MTEKRMSESEEPRGARGGGDRRRQDRRRDERRTPPPPWRRPWAFLLYGVALAVTVVVFTGVLRSGDDEVVTEAPADLPPAGTARVPAPAPPPPEGVAEEARAHADFERLIAEGGAARGRLVRVELYCGSISPVAVRQIPDEERALAALSDDEARIPAAECKWGAGRAEGRREDLILVIPPHFVDAFAQAPMVEDGFVRRRRIVADIEWIGRSEALALRTAGILRRFPAAG